MLGSFLKLFDALFDLLPPANEVWGKVIFSHLFFILFTGVYVVVGVACVVVGECVWLGAVSKVVGGGVVVEGHAWLWGCAWLQEGHAWLGACMVVAVGACVGYDEIRQ